MRATLLLVFVAGCGGDGLNNKEMPDMTPPPPDMATLDPGVISKSTKSAGEAETHVAVAANGFVAVAYIGIYQGGSNNGYVFSQNEGDTFNAPDALPATSNREASDPVLATDAQSNFYLTWVEFHRDQQGQPYDMHVQAARAMAGTTTFGDVIEVTSNPNGQDAYDKPWITVLNDGAVMVTYARTSTGGIFAARSTDWKTFNTATIVEDGGFRNLVFPCQPSDSMTRAYVTYHAGGGIGLRWSDDGGMTWPDVNKTAAAEMGSRPAFDDPTCAATGQEVWVTYGLSSDPFSTANSAKLDSIKVAHSPDGGKTIDNWYDAQDSAAATYSLHPYLIREPNGALDLVYYAGSSDGDAMGSYRHARSLDGGKTWPASLAIKTPIVFTGSRAGNQWLGDYVGLAWARGNLYTSYTDNSSNIFHVAFYRTAEPTM